jgi:Tol biopolymer transport system component/tetratricopeptide (TPR) repeat protein
VERCSVPAHPARLAYVLSLRKSIVRTSIQQIPPWAMWILGLLTFLAAALLILAIVLGVRAGQRQLELQGQQEVAIALADAVDAHARGDYDLALDAYKRVLQLEPDNATARTGIQNVLALVAAGPVAAAPPVSAPAESAPPVAITGTTPAAANSTSAQQPAATPAQVAVTSSAAALMQSARAAFDAGRWQEAISRLVALRQSDNTYQPDQVVQMLFEAYVNLAGEQDNEGNLEAALTYFDDALELRPNDVAVRTERDLIADYLNVITYFGADWEQAVLTLQEIYAQEPDYRDVADRLEEALVAYGDALIARGDPCRAVEQFTAALALPAAPNVATKRDDAQLRCAEGGAVAAGATTLSPASTVTATRVAGDESASAATPAAVEAPPVASGALRGRILYSARDISSGRNFVAAQTVGSDAPPAILQDEAMQPALRPDGQRLVFRNVRSDMAGIGAVDPATGLLLRFTRFAEDSLPTWNPQGNRVAFASNREGDRLWRIYVAWADADGETTTLGLGEAPAWNPTGEQLAFRGCDATGNACGIWLMSTTNGERSPLTTVQADNRPAWAPTGRSVFFMSDGRDGNMEIYRVDMGASQVVRLTDSPALDGLPSVSPDGRWVAFVSNRDGAWKIWVTPTTGGPAQLLAPITGDLGNWSDQGLQWVN